MSSDTTLKLLTVAQMAELLGVRYQRAADLVRRGVIKPVRVGRQIRIAPAALEAFINNGGHTLPGGWRREAQ